MQYMFQAEFDFPFLLDLIDSRKCFLSSNRILDFNLMYELYINRYYSLYLKEYIRQSLALTGNNVETSRGRINYKKIKKTPKYVAITICKKE